MTISKVSFIGTTTAQISRLKDMNATFADLQRQLSSGKKHDTLAGFGADAAAIQRNRVDKNRIHSYLDNLTSVTNRINLMNTAMTSTRDTLEQVITGLTTAIHASTADIPSIAALAKNALAFVEDLTNLQQDGRYLFAGSDTSNPPFQDDSTLNNNFQTEITNWLNGTNSTAQLMTNVDAFTTANLGMNASLPAAGPVATRISDNTELDYTVRADQDGFKEVIRALGFMANMKVPGPGDIPTVGNVNTVLTKILDIAHNAVQQLDSAATRIGSKFTLVKSVEATHEADTATLDGLIGDAESADTTEVAAKIQALQTQLQSSYEVTRIASQLSLINFL